ncbi:hypothetical protein GCM10023147_37170 [Tsukamurella soli]|uniref:Tyr recombinase domain-containing protein n=2 Tax=Tsukamurella soli TaxID=644556 RepID=A0ABP8K3F8_9ACTN
MQYVQDFIHHDPFAATEAELEDWQDSLPVSVIRNYTSLVRPYYGWIHAKGYRADDPAKLLVMPPPRRGIPRPIALERLELALRTARPRILPWLLLAGFAGMRAKEIAYLRVEDFVVDSGFVMIHLVRTKGERERVTAFPRWCWDHIAPMLPEHGPCWARERGSGVVTPQLVSQLCNEHLHSIGFADTLHSLRHFAGTEALEATDNLRLVQEFLGHTSPSTTAIYTSVRPQRLAKMVDLLPVIDLSSPSVDVA